MKVDDYLGLEDRQQLDGWRAQERFNEWVLLDNASKRGLRVAPIKDVARLDRNRPNDDLAPVPRTFPNPNPGLDGTNPGHHRR